MLIKILHFKEQFLKISLSCIKQYCSNINQTSVIQNHEEFKDWKTKLHSSMIVYENFITEEQEKCLLSEIEPYMKRLRYEYDHWDDKIHGYRETEFLKWNKENLEILNQVRSKAFPPSLRQLRHVHVLDLAEDGWIKPHVDSTRFCGDIIATVSLLSDSIMRLTYVGYEKEYWDDVFVPRRSLYIMKGVARYKYNHEILNKKESIYKGKIIDKMRRISIICRSEPD